MPQISVGFAMLLLVIGNLLAVFSDAFIKTLPSEGPVYQFVFYRQLAAVLVLLPICLLTSKQQLFKDAKWHVVRGHVWLVGAIFMVFALDSLPIATANAIFYAAPLIMLAFAYYLLKEKLSWQSTVAAIVGFIGVLVVVQPSELTWAGVSALVVAVTLAANNLLIRKIPIHHSVLHTLLITNIVGMPVALVLAIWEHKPWDYMVMLTAIGSTLFILVYSGMCVIAYRAAQANKIASAEYSGLIGAIVVGLLWFGEIPTFHMLVGSGLIIIPMIWLARSESVDKKKAIS